MARSVEGEEWVGDGWVDGYGCLCGWMGVGGRLGQWREGHRGGWVDGWVDV